MSGSKPSTAEVARADQLHRLTDALEILARRWRREASDPNVARILRQRFAPAVGELFAIRDLLVRRLDTASGAPAAFSPDLLLRLDCALGTLVELATAEPAAPCVPEKKIDINSRFRVARLESATRRQLKRLVQTLAAGAIAATAFAALPAAAVSVGDLVINPVTGLPEEVTEVISPSAVVTAADHVILLTTTVGDSFTDPDTLEVFTVQSVTTNSGGLVTEVTVTDASAVSSIVQVVVDKGADVDADPPDDGVGEDSFTFPAAVGDVNNYVNIKTGKDGKDGKDGVGVRVCIPYVGCHTVAKKPSSGGDGASGPDLNVTLNSPSGTPKPPNWGDIQTTSDFLPGAAISSTGGDGGEGGDAYGNISGASGGKSGKGGKIDFHSSVTIVTTGEESYGIFAKSSSGKGGKGGSGFIAAGGGTGGSPGLAGTVSVTNTGAISTSGEGAIGILAESLGGKAGSGGGSFGIIADGGGGNVGGDGNSVFVDQDGIIHTSGLLAHGVLAQSIGGSGGNAGSSGGIATFGNDGAGGGDGGTATIIARDGSSTVTEGDDAIGLFAQSVGGGGGNGGKSTGAVSMGSGGGAGGAGGNVAVTLEAGAYVGTSGDGATGVLAQSVGGGGGNSGKSTGLITLGGSGDKGGKAGNVDVTSGGAIVTTGLEARGIFAQSVGGGGDGGMSLSAAGYLTSVPRTTVSMSLGGSGGAAGTGGDVTLESNGTVITTGVDSFGVFAQSVGGGGGSAGLSVSGIVAGVDLAEFESGLTLSLGGSGGTGNTGGDVTVTAKGNIFTTGAGAIGVFAQSVGGGGGAGGASAALGLARLSLNLGGDGGVGSHGGAVSVTNTGAIATLGESAYGIFAESVGGGGGHGGTGLQGLINLGGHGGASGDGGAVTVTNKGTIDTFGNLAYGVLAQSVGGGGGNGGNTGYRFSGASASEGINVGVSIGGHGGASGNGGAVTVTNDGAIHTRGNLSNGIFAQSVGGGGGSGGVGGKGIITFSGAAGNAGDGGNVTVTNNGLIQTDGAGAFGIFAQSVGGGGGTA